MMNCWTTGWVALSLGAGLWACDDGGGGGGGGGSDAAIGGAGGQGGSAGEGGEGGSAGEGGGGEGGCFMLSNGECVEETFRNPPVLRPNADGVYELDLMPTEFVVEGKRHCGRAYNGLFPAPTIDTPPARDGEMRQVRVNLRNRFTKSDFRALGGEECACTNESDSMSCTPGGHHGGHDDCVCRDAEGETCHMFDFNLTNLHAHGSHVRPDYATGGGCVEANGLKCRACASDRDDGPRVCFHADDVLSQASAREGVQHRWDIDEDGLHHEGLHWYHPHIHGSTAIQVASGATGAWIVRGPLDEVEGLRNARERVILFMTPPVDYPALEDGQPCDEDHITFNEFDVLGDTSKKQTNLINGIRRPRLVMAPGQVERWRFLHGSFLDEVTLALFKSNDANCENLRFDEGPVPLTQIARDGITLPKPAGGEDWPFAPQYLFMAPGYRIEALLDGSELRDGETLCLMAARFLQADESGTTNEAVGLLTPPTLDDILQALTNGDLVAIVNVTASAGAPTETEMPDLEEIARLAPSMMLKDGTVDALARCQEAAGTRDVDAIDQLAVFWALFYNQDGLDQCSFPDHNVNAENFELTDREAYPFDRVLKKGEVEHWRLLSGFDGHPFHIHINPFIVCPLPPAGAEHRNTKARLFEPPFAHWRDTYLVNLDRQHDLVTEYKSHTGAFVFHCHKLNHEDHGMMELIQICDPAVEDCDTLCSGGPCTWRSCAEGDINCERAVVATECIADPRNCPEAAIRCTQCGEEGQMCGPGSYCGEVVGGDGLRRCVPGCEADGDCARTDRCDAGECVPAPACAPPCGPGRACVHGACTD